MRLLYAAFTALTAFSYFAFFKAYIRTGKMAVCKMDHFILFLAGFCDNLKTETRHVIH